MYNPPFLLPIYAAKKVDYGWNACHFQKILYVLQIQEEEMTACQNKDKKPKLMIP